MTTREEWVRKKEEYRARKAEREIADPKVDSMGDDPVPSYARAMIETILALDGIKLVFKAPPRPIRYLEFTVDVMKHDDPDQFKEYLEIDHMPGWVTMKKEPER